MTNSIEENMRNSSELLLRRFSFLHQLWSIKRYSRDECVTSENVLEHLGWCCNYALIVATDIETKVDSIKIDYERLYKSCVVHDWDEAGSGDISRTVKYATPEICKLLKKLAAICVEKAGDFLSLDKEILLKIWSEDKNPDYTEGHILLYVDISAVIYKSWYEIACRNNYSFYRVTTELKQLIEEVSLKYVNVDTKNTLYKYFFDRYCELGTLLVAVQNVIPDEMRKLYVQFNLSS